MGKRILLHTGTHKTGSTTLQTTLFRHRAELAQHGVTYLGGKEAYKNLYSAFLTDPSRDYWNRRGGKSLTELRARDQIVRDTLGHLIDSAPDGDVIISSEFLCLLTEPELTKLRDFLAPFGPLQAVYYYRELISWLSSDSQQMAKVGQAVRPTSFDLGVQRLYDFPRKIDKVFGQENRSFIRFEDAIKVGICNSLLTPFGIPSLDQLGIEEDISNESISAEAVRALYVYNLLNPPGSTTHRPKRLQALGQIPGEKYTIRGIWPKQVENYGSKRDQVVKELGLTLAPASEIPVSLGLDPQAEATLQTIEQFLNAQDLSADP